MLGAIAGRFLFRVVTVTQVERIGRFVRIDASGDSLRTAGFIAGDKVQVFLPDIGMRTYTPLRWSLEGTTSFLVFAHGAGPGSRWANEVKAGDEVSFFGPRRSIDVREVAEPLVVFGDETSVALSLALANAKPERRVTAVLEVEDPLEVRGALAACGSLVDARLVSRGALEAAAREVASTGAFPLFTGRAASIQTVKRFVGPQQSKTKAYWADGKTGLD